MGAQDGSNPLAVCEVLPKQQITNIVNGVSNPTINNTPQLVVNETYDTTTDYGHLLEEKTTGNDLYATPTIDKTYTYLYKDSFNTGARPITGYYLLGRIDEERVKDGSGTVQYYANHGYDDLGYQPSGSNLSLWRGLETSVDHYPDCGHIGQNGNFPHTGYDVSGNVLATRDPNGYTHAQCTDSQNGLQYTSCTMLDSQFAMLPTGTTDALNHTTGTTYGTVTVGASTEVGLWPTQITDQNGQNTTTTYDALGRVLTTTLPGETGASTTATSYSTAYCPATGQSIPCLEVDRAQRLDNSTTVTSRTLYDGMGRLAETRISAPGSQDVVTYVKCDSIGNEIARSQPFFVPAYTSGNPYYVPSGTEAGSVYTYNGLGEVSTSNSAVGAATTTTYTVSCGNSSLNGDTACYAAIATSDPNHRGHGDYTDALGRKAYHQDDTSDVGSSVYRTTQTEYDVLGNITKLHFADNTHVRTNTYNALSQLVGFSDPDQGAYTLTHDANGNVLSIADPCRASGTISQRYDALNRLLWKGPNSNGTSPCATYNYDEQHPAPNPAVTLYNGIGRLTSETFASNGVTGFYLYDHDQRGRSNNWHMDIGGTDSLFITTYNDADQATSLHFPNGDLVTTTYGAQDWLAGVTLTQGSTTTTLLNNLGYSGTGGAQQLPTSGSVANSTYTWNLSYDALARLTERKVQAGSTTLFDQTRSFDNNGNIQFITTTLQAGTDNQGFCYDQSNRLYWGGNHGTPGCGITVNAGTLTGAYYTLNASYDQLDRMTSGPAGASYAYGDASHLDAVTSAGGASTASYDAAGDMTCRGPGSTCPTGQTLTYDTLRRLLSWTNGTTTSTDAYNGEGERVAQVVTTSGSASTTTYYIAGYEEVSSTSGVTTTTEYFDARLATAVSVNGTLSYLVHDALGSASVALNTSGSVTASALYAPYGGVRSSSGTMPTSKGFTGQRQDTSGLDYFHARFYDPSVGQFTSPDDVQGPNRFAYVQDNPETVTDPSGTCPFCITALFGAVVGAVVGAGTSIVQQATSGHPIDWGQVGKQAVVGAVTGAIIGLVGPEAGPLVQAAVGAVSGAVGQVTTNALEGKPLTEGVAQAALLGGAGGALGALGGKLVAKGISALRDPLRGAETAADENTTVLESAAGGCNSFDARTPVATPDGATLIGQLQVGDQVLAYDSQTGKSKAETVDHVFIHQDTNLLDVTLAPQASPTATMASQEDAASPKPTRAVVASHGLRAPPTETLHTTTEHPFLTTDRGFVNAQDLHVGERVQQLDGSVGVVMAVRSTPGDAVRYHLTVHELHTSAVGAGRWVVHNCPDPLYRGIHALQRRFVMKGASNQKEKIPI